jgi:CheY-like chemotaxis protein
VTVKGPRIMLVDDDEGDMALALTALKTSAVDGPRLVARDGKEALDMLESLRRNNSQELPSVILLDNKMPRMSGLELLERIRQDATLRCVPVVMLSSSRAESDVVRAYELGVSAYVVKPMQFADYSEAVEKIGLFWTKINEPPPYWSIRLEQPKELGNE